MKKMLCGILVLLVVILAGCDLSMDEDSIRAETVAVLDAIVANDDAALRAGLSQRIPDSSVWENLEYLHEELADLGQYRMTAVARQEKMENGTSRTVIRYRVTAGERQFYIDAMKIHGEAGLSGFHVHSDSQDAPVPMPKGLLHWGFTLLGVAAGLFALWAVVDCLRRKPKYTWAYLLMILLLAALVSVTVSGGNLSFNINGGLYLGLSSLTTYENGDFTARIYFPLGAVVYFLLNKKQSKAQAPEVLEQTETEETQEAD